MMQVSDFYKVKKTLRNVNTGHGPASHLWEPFSHGGGGAGWEHEDSSCEMIDLIIKGFNLFVIYYLAIYFNLEKKIDIAKYGLISRDLVFIKVKSFQ